MKITRFRPKKKPRKRKHGFLTRASGRAGRKVLARRRKKGRHKISI